MANHSPLVSSGPREPDRRPRPIPAAIKTAVRLMIRGDDADTSSRPLGLVAAAQAAGVSPWTLRKYLSRPSVIAFARNERRGFLTSLLCGNPAALRDIRDGSENDMARCKAISLLEDIDRDDPRRSSPSDTPFVTVRIVSPVVQSAPAPTPLIDITPAKPKPEPAPRYDRQGYKLDDHGERVFSANDPYR